jgi:hypothetical protein
MANFKSIVHLRLLHQHLRVLQQELHHKLHHKHRLSHQVKHKPQHLPQVRHPHTHLQFHCLLLQLQQERPVLQIRHVDVQVGIPIILEENGVKNLQHVSIAKFVQQQL